MNLRGGLAGGDGEGPVLEQDGAGRWRGAADKLRVTHSQRPVCGSALCFFGTVLHEGAPVLDEKQPKYLLRADVLYRRQRPHDAPPESADDRAAFVRPKPHPREPRPCPGSVSSQLCPSSLCCVLQQELLLQAEQLETTSVNASVATEEDAAARGAAAARLRRKAFAQSAALAAGFGGDAGRAAEAAALWRTR